MLIREIEIEDAENLINLIKEVEAKSNFMLMEAGERKKLLLNSNENI
ncbi:MULTISPECIES: hypothetical protein [unclassified Sutcliffiella]